MRLRGLLAGLAALAGGLVPTTPALAAPVPYFYMDDVSTNEDEGCLDIIVRRVGSNGRPSTMRVILRNGTAKSGTDFVGSTFDIVFPASVSFVTKCAQLIDDPWKEPIENFTGVIRPVSNAKLYDDGTGFFRIADSDTGTVAEPPPPPPPPPPVLTQTCPDGSIIPVTSTCPGTAPTTKTCPDGSVIPVANTCPVAPPPPTQTCWDGTVILATAQCPPEPPPPPPPPPPPDPDPPAPPPDVPSPTLQGVPSIASNFDRLPLLQTLSAANSVTASAAPDPVGAFRFTCRPGQLLRDDPIVRPGQPGTSHGHQFFGNLSVNAHSTYETMRTTGESSCNNKLNRSGYWMPWLQDDTHVYMPQSMLVYYKRRPPNDPKCSLTSGDPQAEGNCIALPRGLRFLFGYDMVTGKPSSGGLYFTCNPGATVGSPSGAHQPNIPAVMVYCPSGARLGAVVKAPDCWNGLHLDSANHRDHMAHSDIIGGYRRCPTTHTYVVAGFTLQAIWDISPEMKAAATAGKLRFSSDDSVPTAPKGTTFHSDWFGAWDDPTKFIWEEDPNGCIGGWKNCSSAVLGQGQMIKDTAVRPTVYRVPIP